MLKEVLKKKGQKYTYIYDFGDEWTHQITIEEVIDKHTIWSELVDGKGACPPEDCGGTWGYENVKVVMNDPNHEEYNEIRTWLGINEDEKWNPLFFDFEATKKE
nr:plasmid pRiA4b ORF-3 family protein [Sphingobacterium sp. IITKGP-BTPF85]